MKRTNNNRESKHFHVSILTSPTNPFPAGEDYIPERTGTASVASILTTNQPRDGIVYVRAKGDKFQCIRVKATGRAGSCYNYYTEMPVDVGDVIVGETKNGLAVAKVVALLGKIDYDPFKTHRMYSSNTSKTAHATRQVVENTTKKIYRKENENIMMYNTVSVKHFNSSRVTVLYDLVGDLKKDDVVVYESEHSVDALHVGKVVDAEPEQLTATHHVVAKIDLGLIEEVKERARKAKRVKAKLDAKVKQFKDVELLKLIAGSDAETASLLEEYSALTGGIKK